MRKHANGAAAMTKEDETIRGWILKDPGSPGALGSRFSYQLHVSDLILRQVQGRDTKGRKYELLAGNVHFCYFDALNRHSSISREPQVEIGHGC